ncbi:MAG: CapA family protein [Pseudomonadota bacterium]
MKRRLFVLAAKRVTAVAGLALVLVGCVSTPLPEPPLDAPVTSATEDSVAAPEAPAPAPALPSLTIAAVGDMMIGTDYPQMRLPDDDAVGFLAAVTPLLASVDIAIGNLEGVLVDGGEPAKRCSNPAACYLFRSPTRYASRFAAAGFDVLSLANNHARDFGEEGRDSSMSALERAGIRHSGREGTIAEWQYRGINVAFVAFAVTRESNSMLDVPIATATVAALAERNDLVIVSFHGGAEGLDALHVPFAEETYYNEPRGDVVRFARSVIDAGADLVLGHGPHVVRGMELYRDRLIAYSLGNFATYYGISVAGLKGIAPILGVTVSGDGRFESGQIQSTHQLRPDGPSIDASGQALQWIRTLTRDDFAGGGIMFAADGTFSARQRQD